MLNLNQIRLLKKICVISLVMLLSFLLVFNTCVVDVYASALAVGTAIFLLITAILAACGITFATNDAAEAGANAFYNNCSPDIQSVLDSTATKLSTVTAVGLVGVSFLAEYWLGIVEAVVTTFGIYEGIDVVLNMTASCNPLSITNRSISINATCTTANSVVTNLYNTQIAWYGENSTGWANVPSYALDWWNNCTWNTGMPGGLCVVTIGGMLSVVTVIRSGDLRYNNGVASNTIGANIQLETYSTDRIASLGIGLGAGTTLAMAQNSTQSTYYQGQLVSQISSTGGSTPLYQWGTASHSNIISGGYWAGTSVAIPNADSICPDGLISYRDLWNVLVGLGFGNDVITPDVGSPSIDAPAYPGNDTWHDGSINDDVAVGNPTIGIAVPTSADDVISLNPDIARDYTSTNTKLGDVVGSDTTTGDTTGDSSGDSTSNPPKNGNTGSLPALSLPEILFKTKFPFCLPWDLYSLFVMLDAEPVAPKFEIPFEIERLGIKESITIDLSQIEEQVEIVRFFLGASFVLALILISRKMIGAD